MSSQREEQPARERRERREAHRREHAARAHVLDALVHVVATGAHLVEGGRVDAVLLLRAAGDRVEPDVRDRRAVEDPHVVARRRCARRGARIRVLGGKPPSNRSGGSTRWSSTLMKIMSSTCMQPARYLWQDPRMPGALDGVRVLDLSWGIAGALGRAVARGTGRRRDQGRTAGWRSRSATTAATRCGTGRGDRSRSTSRTPRGSRRSSASRPTPTSSSRRSGPASPIVSGSVTTRCTRATHASSTARAPRIPKAIASPQRPGYDALVQASSGQQWEQPGWRPGPDLLAHADAEHGRDVPRPDRHPRRIDRARDDGSWSARAHVVVPGRVAVHDADLDVCPGGHVVLLLHGREVLSARGPPGDDLRRRPTTSGCTRRS